MRELSSKMAKCEQEIDALDSSRDLLNHADTFDQTSWDKLTKQMERATCRRESLAETIEEKVRQRASLVQFGMHNAADVLAAAEDPASDLKHVMARLYSSVVLFCAAALRSIMCSVRRPVQRSTCGCLGSATGA